MSIGLRTSVMIRDSWYYIGFGNLGYPDYAGPSSVYPFWLLSRKIARLYLRVSTDEPDLTRQTGIEDSTRSAGYYIAGVYREKASGARADRPELLRMIADSQPGEVIVAEKIDHISRLPLAEAERLIARRSG